MYWEKEIRIRLTTRRIMGVILAASAVVNLVIAGTVFGTAPSATTPTLTPSMTGTSRIQATAPILISVTNINFPSPSGSFSTATGISVDMPTSLPTDLATLGVCLVRTDWPKYYTQQYETIDSIARSISSTTEELVLANCLPSSYIYPGQLLYVPRLPRKPFTSTPIFVPTNTPIETFTATPTATTTATSTDTPTPTFTPTNTITPTPTDTLTEFQNPDGMYCDPPAYATLSVMAYDPQDIISVTAQLYTWDDKLIDQIQLYLKGGTYTNVAILSEGYTVFDIDYYKFYAVDGLGNTADSQIYRNRSSSCDIQPR